MKSLKLFLIAIGVLLLISIGGYFAYQHFLGPGQTKGEEELPTIDQVLEKSVDTENITTNFANGGFIKTKFKIITTSPKNAEEVKKLQFLVESSIIKTINRMTKEESVGSAGITLIEENVKEELNKELGEKYVTRVYLTDELIQ
ncbi:flagellar basal body-associated FliL family protein [Neobacillus citreus]|uniref:Flagellar protein FliL n=1 Tax=Neobacillus citreus TaxID=2833578 RepID=A0A942SUG2_9BACI|nr:flagellar basal body-associated FliL family protein [Neobacillus citreus]MCH6263918.1 flagellar basal body-associated FliL family protein [Neobacillus citreus]